MLARLHLPNLRFCAFVGLGDAVINLREDILNHRINLALAASDDAHRELHLRKALAGLERYFFLVAFASFIAETDVRADKTYSQWLEVSSLARQATLSIACACVWLTLSLSSPRGVPN